ncbi:MAG: V-type ATPase subunit [Clostridiales bacterium]|nr:V-type ATPase subunit [Clostridiales bacterium]
MKITVDGIKEKANTFRASRRVKDDDFIYVSSYLHAVEERGLSSAMLGRMIDADSAAAAEQILKDAYHKDSAEDACDAAVGEIFDLVSQCLDDPALFDFLRFQYDANNMKTAMKCSARGLSPDGMMFSCGSVPESLVISAVSGADFSALPEWLSVSAARANEEFAKTGDPQEIDLPIDRACLEAMAAGAAKTGSKFIKNALAVKIDMVNILTSERVRRMKLSAAEGILSEALASGGNVSRDMLTLAVCSHNEGENDEDRLASAVGESYPEISGMLASGAALSTLERMAENEFLRLVSAGVEDTLYGIGVPFAYIVGMESCAKNARIILAGKRSGMTEDAIRERMRISYV